mgnify:CR=1
MSEEKTHIELIAKQALRIHELEELASSLDKSLRTIHGHLYGINGPLNGNALGYTMGQLEPFFRIAELTS